MRRDGRRLGDWRGWRLAVGVACDGLRPHWTGSDDGPGAWRGGERRERGGACDAVSPYWTTGGACVSEGAGLARPAGEAGAWAETGAGPRRSAGGGGAGLVTERAPIGRPVGQAPRQAGAWPRRGGASARRKGPRQGGCGGGAERPRTRRGLNGAGPLGEARLLGAGPGRSGGSWAWPPPVVGVAAARWAWPRRRDRPGPGGVTPAGEAKATSSNPGPRVSVAPRRAFLFVRPAPAAREPRASPGLLCSARSLRSSPGPCPSWPYHPLLEAHLGWAFWGPLPALLLDGFSFSLAHVYISLTVMGDLRIPGPPGWGCSIHHPVTWAQSHTRGTRLDPTPHTGPLC